MRPQDVKSMFEAAPGSYQEQTVRAWAAKSEYLSRMSFDNLARQRVVA